MRDAAERRVAVGFFDGVHLGHRAILANADAAVTFRNHPLSVLAPDRAPRLIMRCEDRLKAIRDCGISEVTALPFDAELAKMPPAEFLQRYLMDGTSLPLHVFCGPDWRFGAGGAGNADWLRAHGCRVTTVAAAEYAGAKISSSRIRSALEQGDLPNANAMLGHPFRLYGHRFPGKGLGRQLGFATVNLKLDWTEPTPPVHLPLGVYEVEALGLIGLANWGVAPTFGHHAWPHPVLEIHFLSQNRQLSPSTPVVCPHLSPGDRPHVTAGDRPLAVGDRPREIEVSMLRFLRPERKFESVTELKAQISDDCRQIWPNYR